MKIKKSMASDESYLVMKVNIVKEVKRSDGLWRFACGDVFFCYVFVVPMVLTIQEPCYAGWDGQLAKERILCRCSDITVTACRLECPGVG